MGEGTFWRHWLPKANGQCSQQFSNQIKRAVVRYWVGIKPDRQICCKQASITVVLGGGEKKKERKKGKQEMKQDTFAYDREFNILEF